MAGLSERADLEPKQEFDSRCSPSQGFLVYPADPLDQTPSVQGRDLRHVDDRSLGEPGLAWMATHIAGRVG